MTNASAADDAPARPQSDDAPPDDETFEIVHEGRPYQLPAALKGGFLRQADYTRKTQELAAHRKALLAEREAAARAIQAAHEGLGDQAHLAALDRQVAALAQVDWRALAQADPQRAEALWSQAQHTQALRDRYAEAVHHHRARAQAVAARQRAASMTATGQVLSRDIEGWSPELAAKLVDYARGHGVTLDELSQADDPRVWKIIHCAYQGDYTQRKEGAAAAVAKAQAVRPAIVVSGGAASGGGLRDDLGAKEWMKRRNDQVRTSR